VAWFGSRVPEDSLEISLLPECADTASWGLTGRCSSMSAICQVRHGLPIVASAVDVSRYPISVRCCLVLLSLRRETRQIHQESRIDALIVLNDASSFPRDASVPVSAVLTETYSPSTNEARQLGDHAADRP
jgi:hypothetical protein